MSRGIPLMGSRTARKDTVQKVCSHRIVKHMTILECKEQCSVLKLHVQQILWVSFFATVNRKAKTPKPITSVASWHSAKMHISSTEEIWKLLMGLRALMDVRLKRRLRCRSSEPVKGPKTEELLETAQYRGMKVLLCPTSRTARMLQEASTKLRHLDPSLSCLAAGPPW